MLKLMLIILVIVALSVLLLSVNIWLRGGTFRSQHIGQSKAMKDRGIHCAQSMDAIERKEQQARSMRMKELKN